MKTTMLLIPLLLLFEGCAANMAASGQNGPDLNVVKRQQSRDEVERMLGMPAETIKRSDGAIVELYLVEARTEPDMTRAAGHAAADLFTFGLWEFVGGPIEAYHGRRQRVVVEYDESDQVVSVMTELPPGDSALGYQ